MEASEAAESLLKKDQNNKAAVLFLVQAQIGMGGYEGA
jgi:hypothetical protein